MFTEISTLQAPRPIGPFSQGLKTSDGFIFIAGQGPVNPISGQVELGPFSDQVILTLNNIEAILTAGGASWKHVIKVGVYLSDLNQFSEFNQIYQKYFQPPYPTRTTVGAQLLNGIAIEIDCIAKI